MDFEKKKYKKMLKTIIKTLSNFFNTSYTVELIQKPKPAQSSKSNGRQTFPSIHRWQC